jgi:hypothetical protein
MDLPNQPERVAAIFWESLFTASSVAGWPGNGTDSNAADQWQTIPLMRENPFV